MHARSSFPATICCLDCCATSAMLLTMSSASTAREGQSNSPPKLDPAPRNPTSPSVPPSWHGPHPPPMEPWCCPPASSFLSNKPPSWGVGFGGGGGAESGHRGSLLSLPLCTALKKALLQPPPCRCCSSRISLQLALVAVMGPDLLTA